MSWKSDVEATWAELVAGLVTRGFELDAEGTPTGEVAYTAEAGDGGTAIVEITCGIGFPFRPPRVRAWDSSDRRSWHQERDGSLCLYTNEDNREWPWLDPQQLIARISEWFTKNAAGWPGHPPDLDVERYLEPGGYPALLVYRNIADYIGRPVRLRRCGVADVFELVGTGVPPPKRRPRHDVMYGEVVDVGELDHPFHCWDELAPRLYDDGPALERRIRSGRVQLLLVRYTRHGVPAVAAMATVLAGDEIRLHAVESADDSTATRTLRAGPASSRLGDCRVAVIGIGAVGGFIADVIMRHGIGFLTVMDGERLRPGNCVRHLLGHRYVGKNKASATREDLIARHEIDHSRVVAIDHALLDGEEAERLLADHDLVINATAADLATGLLNHLADSIGTPVLSVHLERDGDLVVVHRRPLPEGLRNHDLAPDPHPDSQPILEGGCGGAVSGTAPNAVVAAAVSASQTAVRAIVDGATTVPATIVGVLQPQSDTPLDLRGTLEW